MIIGAKREKPIAMLDLPWRTEVLNQNFVAVTNNNFVSGDLTKAAHHMEIFHELAGKHKWHTETGDSFHEIACEHLRRIYTAIAEEVRNFMFRINNNKCN